MSCADVSKSILPGQDANSNDSVCESGVVVALVELKNLKTGDAPSDDLACENCHILFSNQIQNLFVPHHKHDCCSTILKPLSLAALSKASGISACSTVPAVLTPCAVQALSPNLHIIIMRKLLRLLTIVNIACYHLTTGVGIIKDSLQGIIACSTTIEAWRRKLKSSRFSHCRICFAPSIHFKSILGRS